MCSPVDVTDRLNVASPGASEQPVYSVSGTGEPTVMLQLPLPSQLSPGITVCATSLPVTVYSVAHRIGSGGKASGASAPSPEPSPDPSLEPSSSPPGAMPTPQAVMDSPRSREARSDRRRSIGGP